MTFVNNSITFIFIYFLCEICESRFMKPEILIDWGIEIYARYKDDIFVSICPTSSDDYRNIAEEPNTKFVSSNINGHQQILVVVKR